jgi:hypothetical protein
MSDHRVPDRALATGVVSGLFLMAFFTLLWAGNTFSGWPLRVAWTAFGAAAVGAVLFVVRAVQLIRAQPRMPAPVLSPEDAQRSRAMGRAFGLVFGGEFGAIFVAALILNAVGAGDYVLPVIALIVGLHFYPLGRIFGRRIDAVIATWVSLVGLAGIAVLAATDVAPERVWPWVGVGAALGTAAYGIYFVVLGGAILARHPRTLAAVQE